MLSSGEGIVISTFMVLVFAFLVFSGYIGGHKSHKKKANGVRKCPECGHFNAGNVEYCRWGRCRTYIGDVKVSELKEDK